MGATGNRLPRCGDILADRYADTAGLLSAPQVRFERFYRADQACTRETPGAGLGLSLVQAVVRAYGGRVTIASAGVGQGTTVEVWWPLPTAAETAS